MSQTPNPQNFDYTNLDSEVRIVVQQRTSEIKTLMRRTTQDIIDIGQKLTEVKEQLGHGNFLNWLQHEFEWEGRTARNFMRVAETFKMENFANLDFAASALYLLAAPSTPEAVRHKAITLAQEGETITYSMAKEIASEYKQSQKTSPPQTIDISAEDEDSSQMECCEDFGLDSEEIFRLRPQIKVTSLSSDIPPDEAAIGDRSIEQTNEPKEIKVEVSLTNVRLAFEGDRASLDNFFEQVQNNPNFIQEIAQQAKIATENNS